MNLRQKKLLCDYLYPNKRIRKVLIDDLNVQLDKIIPSEIIFCAENKQSDEIREENKNIAVEAISRLLKENDFYLRELDCWPVNGFYDIVDNVLVNYVFIFSVRQKSKRLQNIDIFSDKRSICYREISVLKVLEMCYTFKI